MRNQLRLVIGVIGALALALVLPGVAHAHHVPPIDFQAATAATTPTIDGVIGDGEWTDAASYDVTFNGLPGTVRFKHDAGFLYVAMTVTDLSGGSKEMGAFFDDNHDGIKDPGEDVMLGFASPFSFGADYYYSSAGASGATHYADTSTDGTNPPGDGTDDIVGAGQVVGSEVTFEMRHPLCSDDTAHDFCLTPGDTVGVDLMYVLNGTGFMYPGADAFAPSDWADLTLSAAPAPAGRIVFESNRDGNLEIYRMNADGSAPTRLTNDPATDDLPSISPDGRKVAFSSDREGNLRHLGDEHRRHRPHAADLRCQPRAAAGLVAGRDEDRLPGQRHRAVRHLRRRCDRRHSRGRDQHGGERGQPFLVAGRHAARLHVGPRRERRDLPTEFGWNGARDAADEQRRARLRSGLVARRAEDRVLQRPRGEPVRDRCGR